MCLYRCFIHWNIQNNIGSAMEADRGSHGSITTQVQCNATFSADDVKKLLEEKLEKRLESYIVFFNNTEVK